MTEPSNIIRLVKKPGTRKYTLTVGKHRQVISRMQALHLFEDTFRAIYSEEFCKEALRKE